MQDQIFSGVAAPEVGAKEGKYPVFGLDLPHQNAVKLGKAGEALVLMGLTVQVLYRPAHGVHRGVGEVAGEGGTPVIAHAEKPPQPQLLFRQTGEKAPDQQLPPLPAQFSIQRAVDPLGVGRVSLDGALGIEGAGQVLRGAEFHRLLLVDIAFKHAGEKAGKAAVIAAAHLSPGHVWLPPNPPNQTGTAAPAPGRPWRGPPEPADGAAVRLP